MIEPTIIRREPGGREVWKFRDQHFEAFTFTDGTVQLRSCDESGKVTNQIPITGQGKIDRKRAVKWLNDNR